jgi:uncharacterized protein involved in response to NO
MTSNTPSLSRPIAVPVGVAGAKGATGRALPAPARRIDPARTPWRMALLMAAPHRLAFFAGALMLSVSALWWAAVLLLRAYGVTLPWAVSSGVAHGALMGFGFMPSFIAGFLFTAGPRWLGRPEVHARELLMPLGLMGLGWAVALPGFHLSAPVAGLGLAIVSMGWALVVGRFALMVLESRVPDRRHALVIAFSAAAGALALWAAAAALALGQEAWARAALQAGLWGCLALMFAAVSHRMIPFFGAAVMAARQPAPSHLPARPASSPLGLLVGLVALQAPLAAADALGFTGSGGLLALRAGIEALAAALLLGQAWRWGLRNSLRDRLLAMQHLGFAWLCIAFALAALSHALQGASDGALSLGLAPLHALTMGFLASTLLAMATRVSCGHGGRALAADDWAWVMFWVLQLAVLARVAAAVMSALWPVMATPLTLLAMQAWVAAMLAWAIRHARWYGRVRADGRPG